MMKLAKDAKHRLFSFLELKEPNSLGKELITKKLIFECFEKGSSDSSFATMFSKHFHTIKTKVPANGYLTSDLFDKPVNINNVKCNNDIDEYLYRHTVGTVTEYPKSSTSVYYLMKYDEYENLNTKKENLIEEIQVQERNHKEL